MIPAPPPPPVAFRCPIDTECYPNYWLFGIQYATGEVRQCRAVGEHSTLSPQDIQTMRGILAAVPVWSFNGIRYDLWLIAAALAGYTVGQLKAINDKIIVEKVKPWQLGIPRWQPADHIDVMEVIPGAGGQKYKAGMIHYKTMRDLPYSPDSWLTPDQMREVDTYNANDLGQLLALADAVKPQIALRQKLSDRYGLDLRSKSDAQVAEAVLKHRCEIALGRPIPRSEPDWNLGFRYDPPAFLQHATHPELVAAIAAASAAQFRLSASGAVAKPPELDDRLVTIGPHHYRMGIGGLHSIEKSISHKAENGVLLIDIDVASNYPALMLNAGAWPDALGPQFLIEFAAIKDERIAAKHLQQRLEDGGFKGTVEWVEASAGNGGGKIMINGTFGKTGSAFSCLFAPKMMVQTTLTGQLSLLMLVSWMHEVGVETISANTDGVLLKVPADRTEAMREVVKRWESVCSLEMEETQYRAIYTRDVNNYIAVMKSGKVKRKGVYAKTDLIMKKAPALEICADACAAYVADGTPLADTILACGDIRKFVAIKNVAGGCAKLWGEGPTGKEKVVDMSPRLAAHGWSKKGARWVHPDYQTPMLAGEAYALTFQPQRREVLGKVVRWYYGTRSPGPLVYAEGKKAGDLVSDSWGAQPCMVLPEHFPDDIDYAFYLSYAEAMLRDCAAIN